MLGLTLLLGILTVTILILIDGFLQFFTNQKLADANFVTILILIDGFLQYSIKELKLVNTG